VSPSRRAESRPSNRDFRAKRHFTKALAGRGEDRVRR